MSKGKFALPCNPDVERFVLGSLMTHGQQEMPLTAMVAMLAETDFTVELHRVLFFLVREMADAGKHIDATTVYNEGVRRGKEESISLSLLSSLTDGMPAMYNLAAYIDILRENTRLRAIIGGMQKLASRAYDRDESNVILSDMTRLGENIAASISSKRGLKPIDELMEEMGSMDELMNPRQEIGIRLPISWLNDRLSGLAPKSLTVLAARPSVGKSALALQIADYAAQQGCRVAFFTLEMSAAEMVGRMISQRGRVNMHRFKSRDADADERRAAMIAYAGIAGLEDRLQINDGSNGTIPEIMQALHDSRTRNRPIGLLVVDYLQLMSGMGKFSNRVEEVSSISRGLKLIAQTFQIPVLALSQLSRESEKQEREPRLSDLRESGSIEQDSDNVIFLHRMGTPEDVPQRVRLLLRKVRGGAIGKCDLIFTPQHVRFDELTNESEAA